MKIIAAIDILNGKCVRLTQGDYKNKIIYNEDPVKVALELEANGLKNLHVVDLDGARSRKIINHPILRQMAYKTGLHIDFGGGIQTETDLQIAFDAGAKQVTLGSVAVEQPEMVMDWLHKYGDDKLILGADCRHRKIATRGWLHDTGIDVVTFIRRYALKGLKTVICTDIESDGMLSGPSFGLYTDILNNAGIDLIASGGIASVEDLHELKMLGCSGAIIGKAIYENRISLKQIRDLC